MVSPSSNPLVLHHLPILSLWILVPPPVKPLVQFTTCLFCHFGSQRPLLSNTSLFTTCLFRLLGSRRPLLANPSKFFTTCLLPRHLPISSLRSRCPFSRSPVVQFTTCLFHYLDRLCWSNTISESRIHYCSIV